LQAGDLVLVFMPLPSDNVSEGIVFRLSRPFVCLFVCMYVHLFFCQFRSYGQKLLPRYLMKILRQLTGNIHLPLPMTSLDGGG